MRSGARGGAPDSVPAPPRPRRGARAAPPECRPPRRISSLRIPSIGSADSLSDMWSLEPSSTAKAAIRPKKRETPRGNVSQIGDISFSGFSHKNKENNERTGAGGRHARRRRAGRAAWGRQARWRKAGFCGNRAVRWLLGARRASGPVRRIEAHFERHTACVTWPCAPSPERSGARAGERRAVGRAGGQSVRRSIGHSVVWSGGRVGLAWVRSVDRSGEPCAPNPKLGRQL